MDAEFPVNLEGVSWKYHRHPETMQTHKAEEKPEQKHACKGRTLPPPGLE